VGDQVVEAAELVEFEPVDEAFEPDESVEPGVRA
jgi:hypothetical protein